MTTINPLRFGIAGAITTSLWYYSIALCIKTWPYETLKFISSSHMIPRLENIAPYIKINFSSMLTGISVHFIFSFLFFWSVAFIYNLFESSKK